MAWEVETDDDLRRTRKQARAFRWIALLTYSVVDRAYECWGGGLVGAASCDAHAEELERECLRYEAQGPRP